MKYLQTHENDYYKKLNLLKVVDGERPIDQINKEISDIISFQVDSGVSMTLNTLEIKPFRI